MVTRTRPSLVKTSAVTPSVISIQNSRTDSQPMAMATYGVAWATVTNTPRWLDTTLIPIPQTTASRLMGIILTLATVQPAKQPAAVPAQLTQARSLDRPTLQAGRPGILTGTV
jgi:hypothetical protein